MFRIVTKNLQCRHQIATEMMKRNLEVGSVVKFFKICGILSSTWPPDPGAQIRERVLRELMWWASILNVIGILLPLILSVYHYRFEPVPVMKSLSEITVLSEIFFNLIFCRNQQHRLQVRSPMK